MQGGTYPEAERSAQGGKTERISRQNEWQGGSTTRRKEPQDGKHDEAKRIVSQVCKVESIARLKLSPQGGIQLGGNNRKVDRIARWKVTQFEKV